MLLRGKSGERDRGAEQGVCLLCLTGKYKSQFRISQYVKASSGKCLPHGCGNSELLLSDSFVPKSRWTGTVFPAVPGLLGSWQSMSIIHNLVVSQLNVGGSSQPRSGRDAKDTRTLLSWGRWSWFDFFCSPPPTSLPSSRESSLLRPGKAERPGGGQAEPPRGYRHPWVCSRRALQTSAMPPVNWVLLVCPGGHGAPPAWYFHSVRAIGLVRWEIKKLLLYKVSSYF